MRYHYAYQNSGHPALSWQSGPPRQTRGADSVSLGSTLADPTLVLPRPGAPEPINGAMGCAGETVTSSNGGYVKTSMGCSGCGGKCGGKPAMGSVVDSIGALSPAVKIGGLIALAYLYKKMKKR